MEAGYFDGPGPEARFKAYLAEGRFMIQRSRSNGAHVFYPRVAMPGTGEADLDWVEASGLGTVYATTCNRARPEHGGDYNIALIDLDEGPRMMARVEGIAPDAVTIGMRVRATIGEIKGEPAVIFQPEGAS
ncbi:OB-fold domain-containing protein [Limibaculum sp. M0105]|uniref:OB-fold domain-containing protein n=1 Tax=Thermohalobaculum xanthum TaxID=2753746 RepID=A0A8J7M9I3_9RHOB|nr:OB-fold domain-containing protein [Thermohalobaculum xanthum]MBK0400260.1 OB-fold domain-containing protein [Thermohalobaculum xanthum]